MKAHVTQSVVTPGTYQPNRRNAVPGRLQRGGEGALKMKLTATPERLRNIKAKNKGGG